MAKAHATCKCATCGAVFEMTAIKSNREAAESWAVWAEQNLDECPACRKVRIEKERAEENKKNTEKATECGYPALEGTPKQVAWANTIRAKFFDEYMPPEEKLNEEERKIRKFIIETYTKASFWIDNRDSRREIIKQAVSEYKEKAIELEAQAETETITAPQEQRHSGVVEIKAAINKVTARYQMNDTFRSLVKGAGYKWNGDEWEKQIKTTTGSAADRAAELGNKLLNAGFAIRIADPDIRRAAVEGDYEPETQRWITHMVKGKYAGWLYITWGRDDNLYKAARSIPQSRYERPGVVVPVVEYASVLDFADNYDFKLSKAVANAIETYKSSIEVVTPALGAEAEYNEKNVADILNSDRDILPDLKDEEA